MKDKKETFKDEANFDVNKPYACVVTENAKEIVSYRASTLHRAMVLWKIGDGGNSSFTVVQIQTIG